MAKVPKYRYDPYGEIIERFNKAGIDYVVVSMSGINYYAQSARDAFMTYDYDIFLKPAFGNVSKAIMILHKAGYETVSTEGPVSKKNLQEVVRKKKTIVAVNPEGITFELLFAVSGFTFRRFSEDASIFRSGDAVIRVAKLHKLLASKKIAGQPKDRQFLKRYEMILKERSPSSSSNQKPECRNPAKHHGGQAETRAPVARRQRRIYW